MKKNLILMIVISIILVGGLTFIGFQLSKNNKEYKQLEKNLENQAIGYYGEEPSKLKDGGIISAEVLSGYKDGVSLKVKDDTCVGYVKSTKSGMVFNYKAYIKCNNYKTNNYQEINE